MVDTTRVIIATEETQECGDFNQCPWLTIIDIDLEKKEITAKKLIANQINEPTWLTSFLMEKSANVIIAKNMDGQLEEMFIKQNIPPLLGVSGVVNTIVNAFIENTLSYGNDLCDHDEEHIHKE